MVGALESVRNHSACRRINVTFVAHRPVHEAGLRLVLGESRVCLPYAASASLRWERLAVLR